MFFFFLRHTCPVCGKLCGCFLEHQKKRYVPIHQIEITEERRESLLAFHALTGCGTTSQFVGIGKKSSAWPVFLKYPKLLQHLGEENAPNERLLSDAEAFVYHLYSPNTDKVLIHQERVASFRRATKNLDALPPTQDALHLHIRRAHLQAFIWRRALDPYSRRQWMALRRRHPEAQAND